MRVDLARFLDEQNTGGKTAGATPAKTAAGTRGKQLAISAGSACPTSLLFDGPFMEQIGLEIQGAQFDLLDRKFEPERLRVVLLLPVRLHGVDIEPGGLV